MLSANLISHRITDLEHTVKPKDYTNAAILQAKIDMLYWVYQDGDLKTEQQVKNRISRIEEELLAVNKDDSYGSSITYEDKTARIEELKYILNN